MVGGTQEGLPAVTLPKRGLSVDQGDVGIVDEGQGAVGQLDRPASSCVDNVMLADVYRMTGDVTEVLDDDSGDFARSAWVDANRRIDPHILPRPLGGCLTLGLRHSYPLLPERLPERQLLHVIPGRTTL